MKLKCVFRWCLAWFLVLACPAVAQDTGRVSPAALPLPLPSAKPVPPDVLRSQNPWNLPMTGIWKFALTHGQTKHGIFMTAPAEKVGVSASSSEDNHPPVDAFDGSNESRWCASDEGVPQWLQADLGKDQRVTGVNLAWERSSARYQCRIEGEKAGGKWIALADATAAPGDRKSVV